MIATIKTLKRQLFPEGSFVANVLILMTGTTIAQAIPIVASPIITRVYAPDEFGTFALYTAIVSIVSVMATGKYELAVMLPEKEEDAINLVALSIFLSSFISLTALGTIWIFNEPIIRYIGNPESSGWLYLVPLAVIITGIYVTFNYWLNRKKQYRSLAISKIFQSIFISGISIGMGFVGFGVNGLILGGIGGQIVATGILGWQVWKEDKSKTKFVTNEKMTWGAKKYIDFPKYSIPADFLYVISNQMPIFLLSIFFNGTIIGFYALTQRVLASPIALIAAAILDVFKQRASSDYMAYGNCKDIYVKTFKSLAFFTIIPFILFFFAAPDIFAFIFGIKWRIAGEYAQILSVMYALKFISSPLTYMYYIAGKQKEDFLLHIYIGLSTFLALIFGYYIFGNVKAMLSMFSINYSIVYIIFLIRSYKFSKGNVKKLND